MTNKELFYLASGLEKLTYFVFIFGWHSTILCFPDEINWPDGEDTPPLDAQELITLLLRQNPLERMGAGKKNTTQTEPLQHCGSFL